MSRFNHNERSHLTRALTAALVLATGVAQADSLLEFRGDESCRADFRRVAISGSRVRMEIDKPQALALIYDNAEKLAQTLDLTRHSYGEFEIDEDTLDYLSDVQSSGKARMRNMGIDPNNPQVAAQKCAQAMMEGKGGACGGRARSGGYGAGMAMRGGGRGAPAGMPGGMPGPAMQANPKLTDQQYEAALAGMSPAQREIYAKIKRDSDATFAKADAQRSTKEQMTEQEKTIGGIACQVRERRVHDVVVAADCVAETPALGLANADLARLRSMAAIYAKFMATVTSGMGGAGANSNGLADLERFPIERVCYANGKPSGHLTLAISHPTLPADLFEIPAGYQQTGASAAAETRFR